MAGEALERVEVDRLVLAERRDDRREDVPEHRMEDTRAMARFVLVHGAWHGGWCFRRVAEELERRGHDVATPDLPCEQVGLTAVDYARLLGPQPDAIVVGHSLGGLTIGQLEARTRVYLGALLPVENVYAEAFVDGFGGFVRDDAGPVVLARRRDRRPRDVPGLLTRPVRLGVRTAAPPGAARRGDRAVRGRRRRHRDAAGRAVDAGWQIRTARAHGAA